MLGKKFGKKQIITTFLSRYIINKVYLYVKQQQLRYFKL